MTSSKPSIQSVRQEKGKYRIKHIARRLAEDPRSILIYARACLEIVYRRFLAGRLILTDGERDSIALVIYAPGQTEPAYSSFNAGIAKHLAKSGFQVKRFDFKPIINKLRPTLDDYAVELFCNQLIALTNKESRNSRKPIILMGKSFGGAIASKALEKVDAIGCVSIGYPFFNPSTNWSRINHLPAMQKKLIIIQGAKDDHGTESQIEGIKISSSVDIRWIQNADHGFKTQLSPEQDRTKYHELLQACTEACNLLIFNYSSTNT